MLYRGAANNGETTQDDRANEMECEMREVGIGKVV